MRIDTQVSEDTSQQIQNLADKRGWQKPKTYTQLINTGLNVQKRREQIKQYIVDFFEEEKPRHDERLEQLKQEYGIEELNWIDTAMEVVYKGNKYGFSGDPTDIITVNEESYKKSVCPECSSEDITLDHDQLVYDCESCANRFKNTEIEYTVPEEDLDHVREFASKRYDLFSYAQGRLTEILDSTMGMYTGGRVEWLRPGVYSYENGFQTVTIPFWTTDKGQINFYVDSTLASYSDIKNLLYYRAKQTFTEDYLQLVTEVRAANSGADKVKPIDIDRRDSQPRVIEVVGLELEETDLPYRTVGYEVEKIQPSAEDLEPVHQEETKVTWIKVVNDKQIELQQRFEDTEDYYLAITEDSFNPIHMVDRESGDTYCGEYSEPMVTDDDRLTSDEPVSRRGICRDCLTNHEEGENQ